MKPDRTSVKVLVARAIGIGFAGLLATVIAVFVWSGKTDSEDGGQTLPQTLPQTSDVEFRYGGPEFEEFQRSRRRYEQQEQRKRKGKPADTGQPQSRPPADQPGG